MEIRTEAYGVHSVFRGLKREEQLHCINVAKYMEKLLKALLKTGKYSMSRELKFDRLREIFLYHDIGKAYVPEGILHKAGKLTDEENRIMQRHTEYGRQILEDEKYLIGEADERYYSAAIEIACCHHEWWDGNGYPRGLKEKQIPLLARVCAVVDVYDALLSDRPYRKAVPKHLVCKRLQDMSGIHFDPEIVKVFIDECDIEKED